MQIHLDHDISQKTFLNYVVQYGLIAVQRTGVQWVQKHTKYTTILEGWQACTGPKCRIHATCAYQHVYLPNYILPHKYSRQSQQQFFIMAERHKHGEQNMPPEVGNKYSRSCTKSPPGHKHNSKDGRL